MSIEQTPRGLLLGVGGWTFSPTLGKGAYAHVRQATHRTGHKAACKILPALHPPGGKMVTWDQTMDAIEAYKEVVLLKALAGAGIPGIVGLEGVIEEGGWTFIFLTLYENSASSIVSPCSRSLLVPFFRRLLKTIQAIHSIDLSHEDIKRSNILLDNAGRPVLVDFGFSHLKADGGHVKSAGGTLDYSSPEKVIEGNRYDPKANDVWSLGILLIRLLGKPHPFIRGNEAEEAVHMQQTVSERIKEKLIYDEPFFCWTSKELKDGGLAGLVEGMLDKDPISRAKILDILRHPWMASDKPERAVWSPPSVKRRWKATQPLLPEVISDLAFLAYLNHEFYLCESFEKIQIALHQNATTWHRLWAGFLSKWNQSLEMEWEDVTVRDRAGQKGSTPSRIPKMSHPLKPLREIRLSPEAQRAKNGQQLSKTKGIPKAARAPVLKAPAPFIRIVPKAGGAVKESTNEKVKAPLALRVNSSSKPKSPAIVTSSKTFVSASPAKHRGAARIRTQRPATTKAQTRKTVKAVQVNLNALHVRSSISPEKTVGEGTEACRLSSSASPGNEDEDAGGEAGVQEEKSSSPKRKRDKSVCGDSNIARRQSQRLARKGATK